MSRIQQIIDSYMSHRQTKSVRREFAEWFNAPTDREEKLRSMEEYWEQLEATMSSEQIGQAYASTQERVRRRNFPITRRPLVSRIARVAMRVAIPVAAAVVTYFALSHTLVPKTEWKEAYAPYGETRSVVLADGSKITINSGSRLIYPDRFTGDERHVFLAGEAFADIAKDEQHKFVLSANDIDITVHGTSFNVRAYTGDSEAEVALISGSVDMCTKNLAQNRRVAMAAGDMVKLDKRSGKISSIRFPDGTFADRVTGNNLTFINSRLSDIAAQLGRTFNVKIVIDDTALADERYYSAFVNGESLEQILSALQLNGNMQHRHTGDVIHLYKYNNKATSMKH